MRILRRLLFLLLFVGFVAGAFLLWGIRWLETPGGAAWLSRQATRSLAESAPGTEVVLEGIRVSGGPSFDVRRAVWRVSGGGSLAKISPLRLDLRFRWPPAVAWEAEAQVERLELAGLDEKMARGQWRAAGAMAGPVRLAGEGRRLTDADLRLEAIPPGGDLSSELLQGLVAMMPQDSTQSMLMKALAGKALFHFSTGQVEVTTEPERYILHLRVDGDHLLDIRIRVPKESLELLEQLFLQEEAR